MKKKLFQKALTLLLALVLLTGLTGGLSMNAFAAQGPGPEAAGEGAPPAGAEAGSHTS